VRDGVVASVERVLERGERIELLVDKTNGLSQQAFRFERSSRTLRREVMLRRLRLWAAAGAVLALVALAIAAAVCGGIGFGRCRR
jgi:vesicle-associated membrane protein 7